MIPFADVKTIFLDVGNTLIHIDYDFIAEGWKSLADPVAPEVLHRAEAYARRQVSAFIAGGNSGEWPEARRVWVRGIVEEVLPADTSKSRIEGITDRLEEWLLDATVWDGIWNHVPEGIAPALETLKDHDYKLVVVSNSDGDVEKRLIRSGLRNFIDEVVDSGIIGIEKPDARIFKIALERSGSTPAETLHVGDLYAVDVVGARNAGVHGVILDPFEVWEDHDCERFRDIGEVTERLLKA